MNLKKKSDNFKFVCFSIKFIYRKLIFFSIFKAENINYKNHFINEDNEWFGSQSILVLNGHTTSMSAAGKRCSMM
jgi:hypothetical protein